MMSGTRAPAWDARSLAVRVRKSDMIGPRNGEAAKMGTIADPVNGGVDA